MIGVMVWVSVLLLSSTTIRTAAAPETVFTFHNNRLTHQTLPPISNPHDTPKTP